MRWKEFLNIGLFALFGISQSAFASFEVELRKLGEYEVIYDSSNHPSSEYSIDLAEFDEYIWRNKYGYNSNNFNTC